MPKNILDTLVAVGGIAGEYEAITEAEIIAATGAPYSPPEAFDNFRVVASRTVQLLGGSPTYVETFQTSAFTLRVPFGEASTNDAQDGRWYFVKNAGTGTTTVETSGAGTSGSTTIATLAAGEAAIVLHGDNDAWDTLSVGASGVEVDVQVANSTVLTSTTSNTPTALDSMTLTTSNTASKEYVVAFTCDFANDKREVCTFEIYVNNVLATSRNFHIRENNDVSTRPHNMAVNWATASLADGIVIDVRFFTATNGTIEVSNRTLTILGVS